MNVVDIVRVIWDDSVGTAGALRNCRSELLRHHDAERDVEALRQRVASRTSPDDARATA
ncbi:hypothetical protein [Actinospongicola halichondriae]|uniref:hypothetical protein n=1 Tax=Actinospongicola halichondriae TaxID=3236844 RepID=UPI003D3CEBED